MHFPRILERKSVATVACVLYLVLVALFTVKSMASWTLLFEGGTPATFYEYFRRLVLPYMIPALISVMLLDAYANGIELRRVIVVIIGVFIMYRLSIGATEPNDNYLYYFWFIAAYPCKLDLRKVVLVVFAVGIPLVLAVICVAFLGISNTVVDIQHYGHGVIRHSFGFIHPNCVSHTITAFVMMWIYWKSPTWNWRDVLIALGFLIISLGIGDGRAPFIIGVLQVLATTLFSIPKISMKIRKPLAIVIHKIATWGFPVLSIIMLAVMPFVASMSGSDLFVRLDSILSTRLSCLTYYYNELGYPLFTQVFNIVTPLDNNYLYIVWYCGLAVLVFAALLFVILGKHSEKKHDLPMAIYIVASLIFFLTEVTLFWPIRSIALFAIGAAVANADYNHKTVRNMELEEAKPSANSDVIEPEKAEQ